MSRPAKSDAQLALGLFALTCASVFWVGYLGAGATEFTLGHVLREGAPFAVPFLAILVCHELGHYAAARLHGVDASLPYFLPLPLPPMGTLGAVIGMRDPIRDRNALFDVGAAGPVAGLVVALPVLAYGLAISPVQALEPGVEYQMEGRSLLYTALLHALKGDIPAGHDVMLGPVAFAGWAGLLVTMMNLAPIGQLDGGHVAYALFGARHDHTSVQLRWALFAFGAAMVAYGAWEAPAERAVPTMIASGSWLVWALVLTAMGRMFGPTHPPTDPGELTPLRRVLSWLCLALFVLLFMPRWLVPQ